MARVTVRLSRFAIAAALFAMSGVALALYGANSGRPLLETCGRVAMIAGAAAYLAARLLRRRTPPLKSPR